jgi:uncharacterized Ntn-hydrolase superfamily protein
MHPRSRSLVALLVFGLCLCLTLTARPAAAPPRPAEPLVCTFSIVACDLEAKQWGVAVASKFLAVGSVVPWAEADVGAIATQSFANVSYGPNGLKLLAKEKSAEEVVKLLTEPDKNRDNRQLGIVDAKGEAATYTGKKCLAWAGGKTGKHYACQGNILTGPEVVDAMVKAFEESKGPLAWRLMAALDAGDKAGGDSRGKQSAALYVVQPKGGFGRLNDRYLDFRVDDHKDPVPELARILALRVKRP